MQPKVWYCVAVPQKTSNHAKPGTCRVHCNKCAHGINVLISPSSFPLAQCDEDWVRVAQGEPLGVAWAQRHQQHRSSRTAADAAEGIICGFHVLPSLSVALHVPSTVHDGCQLLQQRRRSRSSRSSRHSRGSAAASCILHATMLYRHCRRPPTRM